MINRTRRDHDTRMADLTDRLLAGEKSEAVVAAESDLELRRTQDTVQMLQRVLPDEQPNPEMKNRIRAKLAAEWNRTGPGARQEANWHSSRRTLVVRFAAITAIVLLAVLAAFPIGTLATPGAAGSGSLWASAIIVGLLILVVVIWLLLKRRKR
jgi:hypothetical protein